MIRNAVPGRHEQGWALVMVLASSVICITVALALVAARSQAIRLMNRQQQDQIAILDDQIQRAHLKGAITQLIRQQTGGISTVAGVYGSRGVDSALSQVSGYGSTMTGANGVDTNPYQFTVQAPGSVVSPVWQYTPQNKSSFNRSLTIDAGTTDTSDPLQGVQHAWIIGTLPVQLYATPTLTDAPVNYVGQAASMDYVFRDVPLSIYSLYGTGSASISPDQLASNDAGRVYLDGILTVNGRVTASRPLTAQGGIQLGSNGSALTVTNTAAQGATTQYPDPSDAVQDQQQMQSGNQILAPNIPGSEDRSVQVLPTNNFGDPNDPALSQLGSKCEFQLVYTPPARDGSTPGQARVRLQTTDPNFPLASFTNQVTQDSNTMNSAWDDPNQNKPQPPGYTAALNANGTRLMNAAGTAPLQFIVLDYAKFAALIPPAQSQTFYVQGDPNNQAMLILGGNGTVTAGGLSVVTNLDIYVHQGLGPATLPLQGSAPPAISLITSGVVHAAP
ncbi:MAG: hypothetical protein JO069_02075 [Verrucomicrobia bacterium]|nr:hypothetical protein [Verrucomicrobiota bacterium]